MSRPEVAASNETGDLRFVFSESPEVHLPRIRPTRPDLPSVGGRADAGERAGRAPPRSVTATRLENRPLAVWASGPLEVISAFGQPVEPARAQSLVGKDILFFEINDVERGPVFFANTNWHDSHRRHPIDRRRPNVDPRNRSSSASGSLCPASVNRRSTPCHL